MEAGGNRFSIEQPKLLLVEGKDEIRFFKKLISELELANIQLIDVAGKTRFRSVLKTLKITPGHEKLSSLGIVRDADNNPEGAFESVRKALAQAGFSSPEKPLQVAEGSIRVAVMILPGDESDGMLEDLCLASVIGDPAMACVEAYFDCLKKSIDPKDFPGNQAKARLRTYLASREWLEISWYEGIQEVMKSHPPKNIESAKIHAFLSSRYKPDLNLGIAAEKGYWPLENHAFDDLKRFLDML